MNDALTKSQKADKFRNRRTMAWLAFLVLFGGGPALIVVGLSSDALADRIGAMAMVVNTVLGTSAAVVLGYGSWAAYEHVRTPDDYA